MTLNRNQIDQVYRQSPWNKLEVGFTFSKRIRRKNEYENSSLASKNTILNRLFKRILKI